MHAKCIAHGAGDDLHLALILAREGNQHHEERDEQPHQIGKGDEPAVTAGGVATSFFLFGHFESAP